MTVLTVIRQVTPKAFKHVNATHMVSVIQTSMCLKLTQEISSIMDKPRWWSRTAENVLATSTPEFHTDAGVSLAHWQISQAYPFHLIVVRYRPY
jgi:hypothetical protein